MANNVAAQQENKPRDVVFRIRMNPFRKESSRRVSCKDLGNGDCEGWLWKKSEKPGFVSKDWKKFWFTLKEKNLYYYKHKEDDMAQGIFSMPAFIVSPTCDKDSSRKHAFKASNPKYGTFLFASERQEDMVKWMIKLQIACLPDVNLRQLNTINSVTEDYSGGESEDESQSASDSKSDSKSDSNLQLSDNQSDSILPRESSSIDNSEIDFYQFATGRRASGLIEMTIRRDPRSTLKRRTAEQTKDENLRRHLASLQRTLKDKENQLNILTEFLSSSTPITSESLKKFQTHFYATEFFSTNDTASVEV